MEPTSLHLATKVGNIEAILDLLNMGVNVNLKDHEGKTALHFFTNYLSDIPLNKTVKILKILISAGAGVNIKDNTLRTPLVYVMKHSHEYLFIAKILVYEGAVINSSRLLNRTGLFEAVAKGDVKMVKYLLSQGAAIDLKDERNRTILHWACVNYEKQNKIIIKCLLEEGANIDEIDNDAKTPLICAIERYYRYFLNDVQKETLRFLLAYSDVIYGLEGYNGTFQSLYNFTDLHIMVIEHLAKLESINRLVNLNLLNKISLEIACTNYYNQCKEELFQAKNTKLRNSWITFFNLLMDNKTKLKNYAGNKDLIEDFENRVCIKKFPIYGKQMQRNVKKGIKRRELFDKSTVLLSDCLIIFNPTHLIVRDVLDCLGTKELKNFCK